MDPAVQRFLLLRIDVSLPDQAAESGLNMRARAAEAVVKVEMPKGCIQVIAPQQAHHPAAEPDALGLPAGPLKAREASAISSIFFWPSLAVSAADFGGSGGLPLPLCAKAAGAKIFKAAAQQSTART